MPVSILPVADAMWGRPWPPAAGRGKAWGRNARWCTVNAGINALSVDDAMEEEQGRPPVLFGRFMRTNHSEHPCRVRNATTDHAEIISAAPVREGERIVAYIDDIGRVEGHVSGLLPDGFVMTFQLTQVGRERIFKRLQWLRDKAAGRAVNQRRHERYKPKDAHSRLVLPDGRAYPCEVLDISLSGASIKTPVLPQIGTHVMLGKMHGRVVRHHEQGIAVEFVRLMDEKTLRAQIG